MNEQVKEEEEVRGHFCDIIWNNLKVMLGFHKKILKSDEEMSSCPWATGEMKVNPNPSDRQKVP